jgi:hypothetical protein
MFTDTIKNILLIIVIILSVFLRLEKQLQIFECPVKLYRLVSKVVAYFWHQISHPDGTRFK